MFENLPTPEAWADLLVCFGLMWKTVELLTAKVDRLEALELGVTVDDGR